MSPTTDTGTGSGVDYIGTKDAAELLGMTQRGVQKLIERHQLKAERAGRDWLILRSDLEGVSVRKRATKPKG